MRDFWRACCVIGASLIVPAIVAVADSMSFEPDSGLCGATMTATPGIRAMPQRDDSAIADQRIERALLTETVVVCKDFPLDELLTTDLAQRHAIRIDVDAAALKQAGVEPDVPVTHDLRCITLKGALDIIVGGQGLIWEVRNDRIVITAKKKDD